MLSSITAANTVRIAAAPSAAAAVRQLGSRGFATQQASFFAMPHQQNVINLLTKDPKIKVGVLVGAAALYSLYNSVLFTHAGKIYVVQNNLNGTLTTISEPGLHLRNPFFSTVTEYRKIISTSFEDGGVRVRFADTYAGSIPTSFRFKLPADHSKMLKVHHEFRSEANLIDVLLKRNARDVTVITATQYTGEEFFQGGLNQFKNQLADQLGNGIYKTERKQVEVETTDIAPVGKDQADSRTLQLTKQLVWKTVPILDDDGHTKRGDDPLCQYGIEVTQVLLGDPRPEKALDTLLWDKKQLVADRIKAVQQQETSQAQAKTEQMKKEIQRTREVQDAQRQKELAVISQQKEVEIAKQVAEREVIEQNKLADLARIQKEKELNIAKANFDIQQANSAAAIHEAKAIAAKGNAEAQVMAAMYRAKAQNKEVFLAEIQRDIAKEVYGNLKDFKIQMPHNYISGGENAGNMTSNLDIITGLSALGIMEKAGKRTANAQ